MKAMLGCAVAEIIIGCFIVFLVKVKFIISGVYGVQKLDGTMSVLELNQPE